MIRAQIVDILASLISATIVGFIIWFAGGPAWASIGFGLLIYLQFPPNAQRRAQLKDIR